MQSILKFHADTFVNALKALFKELQVPVNYLADEPASAEDILGGNYKPANEAHELIGDVYALGMVNDAIFKGAETFKNVEEVKNLNADYDGLLLLGISLKPRPDGLLPTRGQLAEITRAFNRTFPYTPVTIIFKYNGYISFANSERIKYKQEWREGEKNGKVSLLKDIDIANPHRGHTDILKQLCITNTNLVNTFSKLYNHWQQVFSVDILTKEFYSELSNWYFWALQNVKFPSDFEPDEEVRNATSTIRLITRLMFVWFVKQKGLIPDELFDENELKQILNYSDKTGSTFYKAVLQNLFFATLNTDMSGEKRKFVSRQYGVQGFYRYERFFSNKERFLELTKNIPFLNGGLFENLDKNVGETNEIRIDCFSNKVANEGRLAVPDYLFFEGARHADLSSAYGNSNLGNTKVRGLIEILKSYNFTIEENTPYEIEVALDPELLGKVFENLLASYNPETKTTARKQTGSFYTPREIVSYMVDESILAYLKNKLLEEAAGVAVLGNPQIELFGNETREGQLSLEQKINSSKWAGKETELEDNLRLILAYNGDENPFDAKDTALLIKAIDNCKILDPACGSGAFPMGVLQKMVHILQKLDKDNSRWRALQRQKAIAETEKAYNIGDKDERQKRLLDIDETFDYNASDYGRKLYLIENCIYGVDIQPIAVQIAKLRFFISLVCDQNDDKHRENLGIRPLPNLETKFVTANSLIGINRAGGVIRVLEVVEKEKELAAVRHKHFLARTPETKAKYRKRDEDLRHHIATLLVNNGWGDAVAGLLAGWNPYDQNISATFFDTEWMFGLLQGFDIVIGNPPYVQLQKISEAATVLKSEKYKTFERTGDIYMLFIEKGTQLLNRDGQLVFITNSTWLRTAFGKSLKNFFITDTSLQKIIDLSDCDLFENAAVLTTIIHLQKGKNGLKDAKGLRIRKTEQQYVNTLGSYFAEKRVPISSFLPDDAWSILDNVKFKIKNKVEKQGLELKRWSLSINYGIKTGLNEAFIIDGVKKYELIKADPKSAEILKPLLRGRDVVKYRVDYDDLWLIGTFPKLKIEMEKYPVIEKHLLDFGKEKLVQDGTGRKKTGNKWFETQDQIGYWEEFEKPKIIFPNMTKDMPFYYDEDSFYTNQKCYIITGEHLLYLTAIFNSKLFDYCFRSNFPELLGGVVELSKVFFERIPIKRADKKIEDMLGALANKIINTKKADPQADTLLWEAEIDARVFQLYGLTEEEILQVLGSLPGVSEGQRREILAQWQGLNR